MGFSSALSTFDDIIGGLIEKKIEDLGSEAILNLISGSPIGAGLSAIKRFESALGVDAGKPRKKFQWQRGGWAKSRQDWLDEGWKHDWRSQPRNFIGWWVPGRLPYPVVTVAKVSRKKRRARKLHRFYREAGRRAVSDMRKSSWSRD
jgi:hypothetical protein